LDGQRVKWGEPALGTAAVVTYAIVDRELQFPKARNCAGIGPVGEILSANRISRKVFESELDAAFSAWQAIAGVTFQRGDADSAHILIGAETEPRGRAFTNVAYDAIAPGQDIGTLRQALICLNPDESWKVGFDGNLNSFDLRYTFTHEIGHAIGLDHPSVRGALMDFRYDERFRAPQMGDIRGAVALYGPTEILGVSALNPASGGPTSILERPAIESTERGLSGR